MRDGKWAMGERRSWRSVCAVCAMGWVGKRAEAAQVLRSSL
jgi:hypothetical protein